MICRLSCTLKAINSNTARNPKELDIHHGVFYLSSQGYIERSLRALYIATDGCSLREIAVGSS